MIVSAAKKPAKQTHTWEITLIRERGKFLGFVEAPDEKAAIEEAIKDYQGFDRSADGKRFEAINNLGIHYPGARP